MITSQVAISIQRRYYYIPNPEDPVFYFCYTIPVKYSRGYDVNVIIHIYLIVKNLIYAENYKIVIKTILSLLFFFVVVVLWAVSTFYFSSPFIPTINTHYRKVPLIIISPR
jgi:hypothetical protein